MFDKITNFIVKLVLYPIIFFVLYSSMILFSSGVAVHYNLNNDIKGLALILICASIISFVATAAIHIIFILIMGSEFGKRTFKNWFEWAHLILIYISGLLSLLYALEPILLKEKVILTSLKSDGYSGWLMGFFIAVSNYYFYRGVVTSKDIDLLPYIKEAVDKLKKFVKR